MRAERLFDLIPDAGVEASTSNAVHRVANITPSIRRSSSDADPTTSPRQEVRLLESSGPVDRSKAPAALAATTNTPPNLPLIDSYPSEECINEL